MPSPQTLFRCKAKAICHWERGKKPICPSRSANTRKGLRTHSPHPLWVTLGYNRLPLEEIMVPRTHHWCKAGVRCLWQRSRKFPDARDSLPIIQRRVLRNAEKVPLLRLRFAVLGLDWGWNKRMRNSPPTPQALHQEISSSCLLLEAWQGHGSRLSPTLSHTHTPMTHTHMCTASCTFRVDYKYWERLFDTASKINIFGIVLDLKNLCRLYSSHIHTN